MTTVVDLRSLSFKQLHVRFYTVVHVGTLLSRFG